MPQFAAGSTEEARRERVWQRWRSEPIGACGRLLPDGAGRAWTARHSRGSIGDRGAIFEGKSGCGGKSWAEMGGGGGSSPPALYPRGEGRARLLGSFAVPGLEHLLAMRYRIQELVQGERQGKGPVGAKIAGCL